MKLWKYYTNVNETCAYLRNFYSALFPVSVFPVSFDAVSCYQSIFCNLPKILEIY